MLKKLSSRKLWAAVVAAAVNALGNQIGLTPDQLVNITAVVAAYIVGQGYADGKTGKSQTSK